MVIVVMTMMTMMTMMTILTIMVMVMLVIIVNMEIKVDGYSGQFDFFWCLDYAPVN